MKMELIAPESKESQILECTDTKELIELLHEYAANTVSNVRMMAVIVRRLDELGVEVSIDENSLLPFVRLIAHGQLSPELFVTMMGDFPLLEKAMRLPIPVQERIANNEPMKVMEIGGGHRLVRPLDMTKRERSQVFHGKRLRNEAEQIGWLRDQRDKDDAKAAVTVDRPITVDRKRHGIVANGLFIPLAELAGYVASLSR
jgi:hypothetical protein